MSGKVNKRTNNIYSQTSITCIYLNTPTQVYETVNQILFVDWHVMCNTLHNITTLNSGAYFPSSILLPSLSLIARKPNNSMNFWNLAFARGFMKISAGFSSVGMYTTDTFPSSTALRMKWYGTLICFVHEWNLLSFDSAIAPWLLELIVIARVGLFHISLMKMHSHSASFTAWAWATYSASTVERAIICCFFAHTILLKSSRMAGYDVVEVWLWISSISI